MQQAPRLSATGAAIQGSREKQEDSWRLERSGALLLAVVADGMGGHPAGEIASGLVADAVVENWRGGDPSTPPREALSAALRGSLDRIRDHVEAHPETRGMGSTLVAIATDGRDLHWLSVGDSHLYLYREGSLRHLNEDHSMRGILARRSPELAGDGVAFDTDTTLYGHILMSAVTGNLPEHVDLPEVPYALEPGDRLLLASDGLDVLGVDAIAEVCRDISTPEACAACLLQTVEALQRPGQDNVTVVVIDVD